jgi:DNA polymerase-1
MVRIDRALSGGDGGWRAKLLLQVHDELVLECPPEETAAVKEMVKREMEAACALDVPMVVEVGAGRNWRDAK